ncbi:MAG: AbrB family transcriptional regulator [Microcoleaceae cyanobacterium]
MVINLQSPSTTRQTFKANYIHQYKLHSYLFTTQEITQKIILAIAAGLLFTWLQVPVGWLLGPMIVGIFYAVIQQRSQPLPPIFMTLGKSFVALTTAARFSPETIHLIAHYPIPVILGLLLTATLSLFHGYLLSRWGGIDRVTGLLSFIPGAASSIVSIAEEMGADAVAITVLQYIRVLLVMLIIPGLINLLFPVNIASPVALPIADTVSSSIPLSLNLLILALCCGIGFLLGKYLRLPASGFLGTFIVGLIVFWTSPEVIEVPQWLFATGLIFVGLSIGLKFDWKTVKTLWKAVIIDIGLVLSLICFCFAIGYGFHLLTQVSVVTAILGLTPGGIEAMIATVMQKEGDVGLVLALQLSRMLSIILFSPWLVRWVIQHGNTPENTNAQQQEISLSNS